MEEVWSTVHSAELTFDYSYGTNVTACKSHYKLKIISLDKINCHCEVHVYRLSKLFIDLR